MAMNQDLTRGGAELTGTDVETSQSAGFTGSAGPEELVGQASVMVARPEPGQTVEISAEPGQTYVLDFDPSQARALVDGDNLILMFDDGSQIVFENLVNLAQLEDGPSLQYAGEDLIPTLIAQGVIPGVLEGFELIAPEPGQIILIQAALGQRFIINFDPASAQVSVDGDNLVMTYPNGGQIVIQGLGSLVTEPDAPTFSIAGAEIPGGTLFEQAIALGGEAGPEAATTLEAAAEAGPEGTGATQYSDDLGQTISTLDAQGVIPGVENELSSPDPTEVVGLITEDNPPQADPVTTPADMGESFFKELTIDGIIGDSDLADPDFGGADAETALADLVFTLAGLPTFGSLTLDPGDGSPASVMSVGTTFTSADTVLWVATDQDIAAFLGANPQLDGVLPDVTFPYSVTDAADQSANATVTITVNDVPTVGEPGAAAIDEDLLPFGFEGGQGDIDSGAGTVTTVATGNLDYSFGFDGPGDVSFASLDGQIVQATGDSGLQDLTSNDDLITYVWDGVTHTLTGVANLGGADERPVFTLEITNLATSAYTFTLLDQVDHPTAGTEDDLVLDLPFVVTDADGDAVFGTLSVTIDDDEPMAVDDDAGTTPEDTALVINVAGLFANDFPGADGASVTSIDPTSANGGTVVDNLDGTITYTPAPGFDGTDPFTYTITDGDGDTSTATVTVTVNPVVNPPTASLTVNGAGIFKEDTANDVTINASVGDSTDQLTTVVITGLTWGVSGAELTELEADLDVASAIFDGGTNTLTITFVAGVESFTYTTLTLTPPEDTDVDLSGVQITANVEDKTDASATNSANDTVTLVVDSVADEAPDVSQTSVPSVPESTSGTLTIDLNLTSSTASAGFTGSLLGGSDTDGSESVTLVEITLSDGTLVFDGSEPLGATLTSTGPGTWELTGFSDLTGLNQAIAALSVEVAEGFDGTITGSIRTVTEEANTPQGNEPASGLEPDTSDNVVDETVPFSVVVNPTASPPEVTLGVAPGQGGCLDEDTQGTLAFMATPLGDDQISSIVISGFAGGAGTADDWAVATASLSLADVDGDLVLNTDYEVTNVTADGFTINFLILPNGEVSGTLDVTPDTNSDLDRTLTMDATAVDGIASASASDNGVDAFVIPVDADADTVSASISVTDSQAPAGFSENETGTVTVGATFGDAVDGSETHTITVTAPTGFTIDSVVGSLPDGVAPTSAFGGTTVTFGVSSTTGLTNVGFDLAVTAVGPITQEQQLIFSATATAVEAATVAGNPTDAPTPPGPGDGSNTVHGVECDDSIADNQATATATTQITTLPALGALLFQNASVMSIHTNGAIGENLAPFDDGDLIAIDLPSQTGFIFRPESVMFGLDNTVDALHVLPDGRVVFSVVSDVVQKLGAPGGSVGHDDAAGVADLWVFDPREPVATEVVPFDPAITDPGVPEAVFFPPSSTFSFADSANIDALYIVPEEPQLLAGNLIISTSGADSLPGALSFTDSDLVLWDGATQTATLLFDASSFFEGQAKLFIDHVFVGTPGNDTLTGTADTDFFVFSLDNLDPSTDTITNFSVSQSDKLVFTDVGGAEGIDDAVLLFENDGVATGIDRITLKNGNVIEVTDVDGTLTGASLATNSLINVELNPTVEPNIDLLDVFIFESANAGIDAIHLVQFNSGSDGLVIPGIPGVVVESMIISTANDLKGGPIGGPVDVLFEKGQLIEIRFDADGNALINEAPLFDTNLDAGQSGTDISGYSQANAIDFRGVLVDGFDGIFGTPDDPDFVTVPDPDINDYVQIRVDSGGSGQVFLDIDGPGPEPSTAEFGIASEDGFLPGAIATILVPNGTGQTEFVIVGEIFTGDDGINFLNSGPDSDLMTGGLGADTFIYEDGDGGPTVALADVITDFEDVTDLIDVSATSASAIGDLTVANDASGNATIQVTSTGEFLATLTGIDSSQLTDADFIF